MKVKISYTTELEKVSEIICSMLKSGSDELGDISQSLCSLPVLLKRKESYAVLLEHLDELRRGLADIDNTLSEASSMLGGLVEHQSQEEDNTQPPLEGEAKDADKPI